MGFDAFVVPEVRRGVRFRPFPNFNIMKMASHDHDATATPSTRRRVVPRGSRRSRSPVARSPGIIRTAAPRLGGFCLETANGAEDNSDIAEKCSLSEGRHAVLLMDAGPWTCWRTRTFDDVCAAPRLPSHEAGGGLISDLSARRSSRSSIDCAATRDQRYEAVVHLVTAAIGARFYTQNNKARMEPPARRRSRSMADGVPGSATTRCTWWRTAREVLRRK